MFDHVTIRVSDREASERFYTTVLASIDVAITNPGATFTEWDDFSVAQASPDHPVTRNLHVGFASPSRHHADEFWRIGTEAGYESDGEPGPRIEYGDDYYGSFLIDPDGNSIEAALHDNTRRGTIDHLWIGVSDLEAAFDFYCAIAPFVGLNEGTHADGRRQFRGAWATFSILADGRLPTENLHMAFPVPSREDVDRFNATGFVRDPDGNEIEAVAP